MERNVWSIFDTPKIAQSTLLFFAFEDLLYTSLHLTNPPSLSLVPSPPLYRKGSKG